MSLVQFRAAGVCAGSAGTQALGLLCGAQEGARTSLRLATDRCGVEQGATMQKFLRRRRLEGWGWSWRQGVSVAPT